MQTFHLDVHKDRVRQEDRIPVQPRLLRHSHYVTRLHWLRLYIKVQSCKFTLQLTGADQLLGLGDANQQALHLTVNTCGYGVFITVV